jgi:hypothetical protein
MKIISSFKNFKINENTESSVACKASELTGEVTLYRLTSHPVVDLSEPGEFYFSDREKVNPDFLENKGGELYLITAKCDSSNIDVQKSEMECNTLNCDCIVAVKDDTKVEVLSVEPYKM